MGTKRTAAMAGKRNRTEEEIVEILREAEKGEMSISEICRMYGIADVTFYKWRKRYGGMKSQRFEGSGSWKKRTLSLKKPWVNMSSCSMPARKC